MAQLDYVYLADYATVQDGKITAVGASFTHLRSGTLPGQATIAVAGRLKMSVGEEPVQLGFTVEGPDAQFRLNFGGSIGPSGDIRPYGPNEDKVGVLFAINLQVPLPRTGLYEITVSIDESSARRLAFDVEAA